MFRAYCFKIAAFTKIGFGRLYERKATMELIILTLIIQLIQGRENFNSESLSTRKIFTLHGGNIWKYVVVSLGKKDN